MITTGSKLLIGATVLTTVAAIAYGITQDGVLGTIGLASAAVAFAFLATLNLYLRDSNVPADTEAIDRIPAALHRPGSSAWPFLFGFGAVTVVVGLVSYQAIFTIGVVVLLAAGASWTVQAWSEGASSDRVYNAEVRNRVANSLEFPLIGAIGAGIIVYAFSRVMLWLSKTNTVVAFAVVAMLVLLFGFLFALRPSVRNGVVAGVVSLGAIGVVAGGAAAGIDGERDIHVHEVIAEESVEGLCESPEEFEVDENASQTVANKANVAATITLTEDGTLEFDVVGPVAEGATALQLPRSNPSNVIFSNESSEHRRLSLDLGTIVVEGEDGGQEEVANQTCTTLVEEGGQQLMTLTIGEPSFATPGGYSFFVPGVDTAQLELVVL